MSLLDFSWLMSYWSPYSHMHGQYCDPNVTVDACFKRNEPWLTRRAAEVHADGLQLNDYTRIFSGELGQALPKAEAVRRSLNRLNASDILVQLTEQKSSERMAELATFLQRPRFANHSLSRANNEESRLQVYRQNCRTSRSKTAGRCRHQYMATKLKYFSDKCTVTEAEQLKALVGLDIELYRALAASRGLVVAPPEDCAPLNSLYL